MRTGHLTRKFEQSLEMTKTARKEIQKVLVFLLIVAGLLYYVCTHAVNVTGLRSDGLSRQTQSGTVTDAEEFFTDFRLSREKLQKEQIDLVRKVMEDKNASAKVRDEAHLQYLSLVDAMGKELKIEGILKSKGLESLVFLAGDSSTVVIKKSVLSEKDVAQIGDTVKRIARINLENITIVPTPE